MNWMDRYTGFYDISFAATSKVTIYYSSISPTIFDFCISGKSVYIGGEKSGMDGNCFL